MTTPEFLSHLHSLNVELWVHGERLRCNAPKAVLTPELQEELKNRKEDILLYLRSVNGAAPPLQPASRGGDLPLSFAQQRLWFLDQLEPESSFYNISQSHRLEGVLNVEALRQSLSCILDRHEVLRTTITVADGNPIQVVGESQPCPLTIVDLSEGPDSRRQEALHRTLDSEAKRPFDLSQDLMARVTLLRMSPTEHILLLVTHHIASDGWSSGVFFRELAVLYQAFCSGKPSPLPELPIQYADYALWQRQWLQGKVLETQLSYWKKQLQGAPVLQLPTDRPRPAIQSYRGSTESSLFSKALSNHLQALSRQQGVTLFMTLLAAFQTLLYRYCRQEDIAVGTPIAGRTRSETEGLIGFFVNTLVLRSDLSANPTFRELLARVRQLALQAYEHQDLPFEKLVEELHPDRDLSRSPLFQVMFAHQNAPRQRFELPGLTVRPVEIHNATAKFDLSLSTRDETGGLKVSLEYNTDLFEAATMRRMLGHFQVLLEGIVANPEQRLSELPILTEAERHQLLVEWNDTKRDYPKDQCIHELFQAQVERTPEAIALVFEDKPLSYRELNAKANQLGHYLRKLGVGPEVLVGICMERSMEMVIGLLGILKAGGAYVPLDPAFPKERLAFMMEDSQVSVLLTQQQLFDRIPAQKAQVVCIDRDWEKLAQESELNTISKVTSQNSAFVIYTSGTTGAPKGAIIEHKSLANYLCWFNKSPLTQRVQILPAISKPTFDASLKQIFAPLLRGTQVWVLSDDTVNQPDALLKTLSTRSGVGLNCVPSLWKALLDSIGSDLATTATKTLSVLFLGGEQLNKPLVNKTFAALPYIEIWNLYGPTEATANASVGMITTDGVLTVGRPVANTQIYILDSFLQPLPIGVPGDLHIGGDCLARGYLNRPELTSEKFIPNPFSEEPGSRLYKTGDLARYMPDGNIEFLGRVDHQVKIRGIRIEPGEIEALLCQHPNVREAVVVAWEDVPGEKRLVGYVVPSQEPTHALGELRCFLQSKLPDYMVPSIFVMLSALPLTSNGKIDLKALPLPNSARPERESAYVSPQTSAQEVLAEIWAQVLKLEQVGIHDNFFELGGHSLLAMQAVSRIRNAFDMELPLRDLFEKPTVAGLAERIETIRWATRGVPHVDPRSDEMEIEL